jgi:hypothetical protein
MESDCTFVANKGNISIPFFPLKFSSGESQPENFVINQAL